MQPHTLYLRHHHKHFHFCFRTVFSNSLPLEKILIFLTSCTKSSSVGSQRPNCPPTSGHYSSYNRRHLAWSFTRGRGQLFWVRSPTTHHANVLSTRESFLHDKKHLNRLGVSLFARGLTRAIYKGVNIRPSPTRIQRQAKGYNPKFNNQPHTSRDYSYGRPSNQSYIHNYANKAVTFEPQPTTLHNQPFSYSEVLKRPTQSSEAPVVQPELINALNLLQGFFSTLRAP